MRINHNLSALNTYSRLNSVSNMQSKSLEKLSSGLRINRAADDAAGLAISEKMRGQISGLNQAQRNAQDGISMIQTAEGALNETHSILQRIRELTVQAGNSTLSDDDKGTIQNEITELTSEIDSIAGRTEFNGINLLEGKLNVKLNTDALDATADGNANEVTEFGDFDIDVSGAEADHTYTFGYTNASGDITLKDENGLAQTVSLGSADGSWSAGTELDFDKLGVKITLNDDGLAGALNDAVNNTTIITSADSKSATLLVGANAGNTLDVSIGDMRKTALGSDVVTGKTLTDVNVKTGTTEDNLKIIDKSINDVSDQRSKLGAYQNRLEHTINNLSTAAENMTASESRIRDVDMAKEMMEFTKNNILSQAATSMLAQANQSTQGVLQLLR